MSHSASSEKKPFYVFTLYISGLNPHSFRAIENFRKICEENLGGRYELKIVDLSERKGRGKEEKIVVLPTLVKDLPAPVKRIIGDLADKEKVKIALDIL